MMVVEEMAMNLSHLSEEERKIILNVLRRDEELQKQDEKRLKVLNTEIQRIRKNSALKAGVDPGNTCSRCHRKLGIIFDTGDLCPRCHSKVCSFCRDNLPSGKWVCILCHKQLLLRAKNGRWFYDHVKKKFNEEEILGASRIVRESIRRSKAPSIGTTLNNNPEPTGSTSVRSEHLKKSKNEDFESIDSLSLSQLSSVSHIEVRKVHSHAYDDSDSSTEEEEDPEVAMTRVPIQTRSLSIQSSSAFSSQSERTITPSDLGVTTQQRESKDAGYNSHHGRQDGYGLSPDSVLEDPSNTNHHGSTAVPTVLHPDNGSDSFSDVDYTDDLSNDEYGSPPKTDKFDRGKSGDRYDDYYHDSPQSRRSAQSGGFSHDSRHPPLERDRDHYHYHYLNKTAYVGRNSPRSSPRGPSPRRVSPNSGSTPRSSYTNSPTSSSRFPHGDTNVLHEGSSLHSGLDGYNSTSNSASNATSSPRCSSADSRRQRRLGVVVAPVSPNTNTSDHPADQEDREQLPPQVTVTDHTDSGADGQSIISSELSCSRVAGEDGRDHENIDDIVAAHRSLSGSRSNLNSSLTTSLTSIPSNYSGAGANYGKIPITGDVLFGIDYNYKVGYLEINVKKCRDLAVADVKKEVSNPYIKTYLLPNKTKASKRRTSTKKNTVEPIYDEVLRYTISQSELETRTLWLSVWHSAGLGRNDFLGEVMIPFEDYEFKASIPQWYPLVGRRDESPMMVSYKGELSIALKYVPPDSVSQLPLKRTLRRRKGDDPPPNMGELHVLIKNAKDLTANKSNDTSDPFCKGYLLPDKSSTGKQKTAVCRKTCNPEWLHTFIYGGVTSTELQECCLELTIWDHERVSTNDFLGGLRLSLGLGKSYGREVEWMDSLGDEVIMWQSMLQKPNSWIEGTLALRPTMDYR